MSSPTEVDRIIDRVRKGGKILICGNGGLAAEAEHFAAEMVGKFGRDVYVPCISLTTPSALITALANDIGYENVFAHQVSILGCKGDVFIGMTTSRSPNILRAHMWALSYGLLGYLWDCEILQGNTVAEKQEYAVKKLHELASGIKEGLSKCWS